MFSFTSFGVKLDKELASARQGVYTFRAQGMVYQNLPGLLPNENSPGYFQLYFYETENEVENRMSLMQNSAISGDVVKRLMHVLEVNPYAKFFRRLKEYPSMDNLQLHISKDVKLDQRLYNCPTSDQVAAVWVEGNNENMPIERYIIVHAHSGKQHRIMHYYGCYDPLQYPLLLPRGEIGWHQNIRKVDVNKAVVQDCDIAQEQVHIPINDEAATVSELSNPTDNISHENPVNIPNVDNTSTLSTFSTQDEILSEEQQGVQKQTPKKVSCREYYCYKLQMRNPRQSALLMAGRLLQQYAVDMYIKLESTRLDYYRRHQSNMRAELYQGILDNVFKGETRGSEEAAQKRGLLEADQSIFECLNEAVSFQMPYELRRLFAIILVYCAPTEVRVLWDTYFTPLSEDFKDDPLPTKLAKTLYSLNCFLESMGKSISMYDLPMIPAHNDALSDDIPREIRDEMSIEIPLEDQNAHLKLNDEQQRAFVEILDCIQNGEGGIFFIDGPGGTGKTFLYRALLAQIRSQKHIALATATSGVAAGIMPGGRTAHSRFKISIEANESSECSISKQSGAAELLRKATLIIWDEAPMAKRWAVENVDKLLKDVMGNDKDFGGKVIVFGGDFRQVLPVVPKATISQTISASLVKSYLWPKMKRLTLSRNMRSRNDPTFSEFLLRVGNGDEPTDAEGNVRLPDDMIIEYDNDAKSTKRLIEAIFPNISKNAHSAQYIADRGILTTKNEHVDQLNNDMISMFPGEAKFFFSFDEALGETDKLYEEEFLNSLTPNGLPPHKLVLKKNCPIILLRNLDPSNGLSNGTRMICRNFKNSVIDAEIVFGQHPGKHVFIQRIPLSPAEFGFRHY